MSIRNKLLSALGIVSLLFMVYSGYIKWIPGLFMDPFVFFIILLFVTVLLSRFRSIFAKDSLRICAMLLLFFTWAFISTFWGASDFYYIEKIQKSLVIMVCFFSPFFILRTGERIRSFIDLFYLITILTAVTICFFYIIYGDVFIAFYGDSSAEESTIPNYLMLGILLASGFILAIKKSGALWLIYKSLIFIAIVLLAPRGPLLTLILFTIVYNIAKGKFTFKRYNAAYLLIAVVFIIYFSEGITARLFSRLSDISESNSSAFSSVGSRLELSNSAISYFKDFPLGGIGYGSFGIKFIGFEDRIEPHNVLFEIAAETGIIGIILFSIFILGVYYYAIRNKLKEDPIASALIVLTLYLFVQSLSTTYLIDSKALFFWFSVLICYLTKPTTRNEGEIIH